jgi:hypothetical protein
LYPILATACLLSVGAAMMAIEIISRSRHNRAMSREAQELGLAFSADTRPFEGSDVHGLPFLQGDASVEAANVMQATLDGRRALVLELPSCEGCEAETPHRHFTTVAAFRSPGIDIPEFEVGRKCTLSKLVDALFRNPRRLRTESLPKNSSCIAGNHKKYMTASRRRSWRICGLQLRRFTSVRIGTGC